MCWRAVKKLLTHSLCSDEWIDNIFVLCGSVQYDKSTGQHVDMANAIEVNLQNFESANEQFCSKLA